MTLRKFGCQICEHIADWACPECGATKADFQVMACASS